MANVDALTCEFETRHTDLRFINNMSSLLGFWRTVFKVKEGKKLTRFHPKRLVRSWISIPQINDTSVNKSRTHTNRIQLFVRQHKQSRETAHMVIFKRSDVRQSW